MGESLKTDTPLPLPEVLWSRRILDATRSLPQQKRRKKRRQIEKNNEFEEWCMM